LRSRSRLFGRGRQDHAAADAVLLDRFGACGTFAAILADLFPTKVRFSGVAFYMNIGAVIFSDIGPVLATWLIVKTGQ